MAELTLAIEGVASVAPGFDAADKKIVRAVQRVVREFAPYTRDLTRQFVPRRSGFMHDTTKSVIAEDRLSFETGWDADDYFSAGKPFYPPYVEFGTQKMAAQPSLGPAMEIARPQFKAAVENAIQEATS